MSHKTHVNQALAVQTVNVEKLTVKLFVLVCPSTLAHHLIADLNVP